MANTYQLISSVTVGSGGAASIDFTSIPATYTDLKLVASIRVDRSGTTFTQLGVRLNGSSSSYSTRTLEGNGSTASSANNTTPYFGYETFSANSTNSTTSTFSSFEIYLPNYAGSANKSGSIDFVSEQNATTANAKLGAALWSNTAAINQITLNEPNSNSNFVQYSTAYLYGIKNS